MQHTGRDKYRVTFFESIVTGFNIKINFPFFRYEEFSLRMTMKIQGIIKIWLYYRMMQGERAGAGFMYDVFSM